MTKFKSSIAIGIIAIILAGCAAKPVAVGDSLPQQKNVTFPKIDQQVHVLVGGLVHLRADYKSRYGYKLKQPVSTGFVLGRLNVTTDDALFSATLEDKPVFCTVRLVYADPLVGPKAKACFVEGEKGTFTQVKAAPGAHWFTKDLPTPVPFIGTEVAQPNNNQILKRELVFEGQQNGSIFFTEKEYIYSTESPSKAKQSQS